MNKDKFFGDKKRLRLIPGAVFHVNCTIEPPAPTNAAIPTVSTKPGSAESPPISVKSDQVSQLNQVQSTINYFTIS